MTLRSCQFPVWAPSLLLAAAWQSTGASAAPPEEPASAQRSNDGAPPKQTPCAVRKNVDRLLELVKKRPAAKAVPDQLSIWAISVDSGEAVLAVREPIAGLTHCGSPSWSNDGTRIDFDVTLGSDWRRTRLAAIDASRPDAGVLDMGPGNCPTLAPDGRRIVFFLNSGAVAGTSRGLWIMQSDGSGRRSLGTSGNAKWSPDGRRLLVASFSSPVQVTLIDPETSKAEPVQMDGHRFYSAPSWADEGETMVVVASWTGGAGIVLVDVADPTKARVKRVVWRKDDKLKVDPFYPIVSSATDRCVFAGRSGAGMALYRIGSQPDDRPRRLERGHESDGKIASLAFSPDGRYVLFCSDRDE